MLNPHGLYIHLHEVMDNTPWLSYYQARTHPKQCIADYESTPACNERAGVTLELAQKLLSGGSHNGDICICTGVL